jgi:hypothetical protein
MPITTQHLVKPPLQQNSTRYTKEKPGDLHKSPDTAKVCPNDAYDRMETYRRESHLHACQEGIWGRGKIASLIEPWHKMEACGQLHHLATLSTAEDALVPTE